MKGRNEAWLRDTLFANPKIIPIDDIDSTFGPLVPLCKELRTDVGGGKDHLKKWWQPLLGMKFDDPEQEAPFWVGTNNVVLKTPFPGVRIKAASSTTQDNVAVFVSGRNVDAIRPFVGRERQYLLDNLPKESIVHHKDDWPIVCANRSSRSKADKYAWLRATLNSFVNVLRPRLRGWYAEAQKPS